MSTSENTKWDNMGKIMWEKMNNSGKCYFTMQEAIAFTLIVKVNICACSLT